MKNKQEVLKILKNVLFALPIYLVIIAINLYSDPANILHEEDYTSTIGDIILSGYNAANIGNYNEELLLDYYANRREEPVQTLALGSSRILGVTAEMAQADYFYNAGLSSADLKQCINSYMLFDQNALQPQKVIIAPEFWFLSKGNISQTSFVDNYLVFCEEAGLSPLSEGTQSSITPLSEFLSLSYFQASVDYLLSGHSRTDLVASESIDNLYATKRSDGTYGYSEEYRLADVEQIDFLASVRLSTDHISGNYTGVDEELQLQFETFITYLLSKNIEVEFIFMPIHPMYYDYLDENFKEILQMQDYYAQFAGQHNIACYGSYSPYELGLSSIDFYDAVHPKPSAIESFYVLP